MEVEFSSILCNGFFVVVVLKKLSPALPKFPV